MPDRASRRNTGYARLVRQPGNWLSRTYLLTEELVARLDAVAEANRVGVSDLIRYLLTDALKRVESGDLRIPTKPPGLLYIDHDRQ